MTDSSITDFIQQKWIGILVAVMVISITGYYCIRGVLSKCGRVDRMRGGGARVSRQGSVGEEGVGRRGTGGARVKGSVKTESGGKEGGSKGGREGQREEAKEGMQLDMEMK